jgi:hypothetical protein
VQAFCAASIRAAACVPDHSVPAIGGGIENMIERCGNQIGSGLVAGQISCRMPLEIVGACGNVSLFGPVVARRACRTSDFTQDGGHASPLRYSAGFISATSS